MSITMVDVARRYRERAEQTAPAYSTSQLIASAFPRVLVTGYDMPSGIDEAVAQAKGGPVILYDRKLSTSDQRFAIAHGVAHLIFDDDAPCIRGRAGSPSRERRADAFAAELLVPLDDLASVLHHLPSKDQDEQRLYLDHVDYLASVFKAPSRVIRQRVRQLVMSSH